MCFTWCLIDKAQLLISSEMNGERLGKPTRPPPAPLITLRSAPAPPGNGPSPPTPGPVSHCHPPPAPVGTRGVQPCTAGTNSVSEPPRLAPVQCRKPPLRPSAKHPPARAQPETLPASSGGEAESVAVPLGSVLPVPGTVLGAASPATGGKSVSGCKSAAFPCGARLGVCAVVGKVGAGRRVRLGSFGAGCEAGAERAGAWVRALPAACAGRSGQGAGARQGGQPAGTAGRPRGVGERRAPPYSHWGGTTGGDMDTGGRVEVVPSATHPLCPMHACHHAGCPQGGWLRPNRQPGHWGPQWGQHGGQVMAEVGGGGDEGQDVGREEVVGGAHHEFWGTLSAPPRGSTTPPLMQLPEELSTLISPSTSDVGAPAPAVG